MFSGRRKTFYRQESQKINPVTSWYHNTYYFALLNLHDMDIWPLTSVLKTSQIFYCSIHSLFERYLISAFWWTIKKKDTIFFIVSCYLIIHYVEPNIDFYFKMSAVNTRTQYVDQRTQTFNPITFISFYQQTIL